MPKDNYKAARAQEIAEMSKEYGLYNHRTLLIAHLLRECGSMTEFCDWEPGKASNDHGFAIGLAQWHVCWREYEWANKAREGLPNGYCWKSKRNGKIIMNAAYSKAERMRAEFFKDHPDMTDWRKQARRYLAEIRDGIPRYGSVEAVVDSWNSHPNYMRNVYANKPLATSLLTSL